MLFDEENYPTTTSYEQCSCERVCSQLLNQFICGESSSFTKFRDEGVINAENEIRLLRRSHADYLIHNFDELPAGFVSLDASRPWIIYWILHSLYLLGVNTRSFHERIISTLQCIQNKSGGFGGGPMQISQGAPNYAAVLSLCMIGSSEALSSVDRQAMYRWFLRLKQPSGGFSIHIDGETDTRSTYTVISISRLLNILTPELTQGVADFVLKCQTYEGGFGGEPGNEAHGGYNFCALATLLILGDYRRCNLVLLEKWLLNRQMKFEGGFQGRTNKLVDSCYSFWQGSAAAILEVMKLGGNDLYDVQLFFIERTQNIVPDAPDAELQFSDHGLNVVSNYSGSLPFNQYALQKYILHCAQNFDYGGMRDKPGKSRDFYHCCYSLSGLSVSQRSITAPLQFDECRRNHIVTSIPVVDQFWTGPQVYGDSDNLLEPTSIVYNIGVLAVQNSLNYFKSFANDHSILCE